MNESDQQFTAAMKDVWRRGESAERTNLIYGIARYVSKLGTLNHSDRELRAMAGFFNVKDAILLYEHIRDDSGRLESEWRAEYLTYFPIAAGALPAPLAEPDFQIVDSDSTDDDIPM